MRSAYGTRLILVSENATEVVTRPYVISENLTPCIAAAMFHDNKRMRLNSRFTTKKHEVSS
jgi:hypothetical protein